METGPRRATGNQGYAGNGIAFRFEKETEYARESYSFRVFWDATGVEKPSPILGRHPLFRIPF